MRGTCLRYVAWPPQFRVPRRPDFSLLGGHMDDHEVAGDTGLRRRAGPGPSDRAAATA